MRPNNGITCPTVTTHNPAGKDYSPHPHADGSAATAGSGLTRVWAALIFTYFVFHHHLSDIQDDIPSRLLQ
jgi:hypothetical protein